jgi:hypothetical protein
MRQKTRKGDEGNKPLLNQVNYVLLHLHLAGKHDAKPSHEELKDWLQWPSRCSQNGSKNKIITDLQDPDSV